MVIWPEEITSPTERTESYSEPSLSFTQFPLPAKQVLHFKDSVYRKATKLCANVVEALQEQQRAIDYLRAESEKLGKKSVHSKGTCATGYCKNNSKVRHSASYLVTQCNGAQL